jgi:hypothetical protein
LPEFLRLVHAITRRVTELVEALISLNDVPELEDLGPELEGERQEPMIDWTA